MKISAGALLHYDAYSYFLYMVTWLGSPSPTTWLFILSKGIIKMTDIMRESLIERFHVPVYETGSITPAIVMKFPAFYLKIYDDGPSNYTVQIWNYDGQVKPIHVSEKNLINTIEGIMKNNMNFVCGRYGIPVNTSDCFCCPYSRSCDTYATVNGEHDEDE